MDFSPKQLDLFDNDDKVILNTTLNELEKTVEKFINDYRFKKLISSYSILEDRIKLNFTRDEIITVLNSLKI